MKNNIENQKSAIPGGFSLLELLVAVAIVVVLAAILFPATQGLRDRAGAAQCSANLRKLATGALQWVADNNGKLPDMGEYFDSRNTKYSLFPYLDLPMGEPIYRNTVFTCPVLQRNYPTAASPHRTYSINRYSSGSRVGDLDDWEKVLAGNPPLFLQNVEKPSRQSFFMDGGGGRVSLGIYRVYSAPNNFSDSNPYPHGDGFQVVFMDGHVERISKDYALENLSQTMDRKDPFWGAGN